MPGRICVATVLLSLASVLWAQSGSASFYVPRASLDGGAVAASSPSFTLTGAVGQPDAAPPASSASYTLSGGFHRQAVDDVVFGDGFESP